MEQDRELERQKVAQHRDVLVTTWQSQVQLREAYFWGGWLADTTVIRGNFEGVLAWTANSRSDIRF